MSRPLHRLLPMLEKAIIAAIVVGLSSLALAQEPGWQFSPMPGEGDRAAMGCASGSTRESFACLAVRCEDDFGVGLHVHTSGPRDDAGHWLLQIDDVPHRLVAQKGPAPYNAQVQGDVLPLIDEMKNGAVAYLERPDGGGGNPIPLSGSLYAINQALYFCAPKVSPPALSGDEIAAVDGQDGAGDVAGER